ncbi:unnamed protein product [Ixodes hexagonus]
MADTADEVLAVVNETLAQGVKNDTVKFQPTPAGMAVAYVSIMLMAFFPIVFGSFKSVTHQKKQKASNAPGHQHIARKHYPANCHRDQWANHMSDFGSICLSIHSQESGEKPETMTRKDAAMFPVIASGALFGLYIFFKASIQTSS